MAVGLSCSPKSRLVKRVLGVQRTVNLWRRVQNAQKLMPSSGVARSGD